MNICNVYRTIKLNTKIKFFNKKRASELIKQFSKEETLKINEYLKKNCNPLGLRGMKSIPILRLCFTQARTISIKVNSNNCCDAQVIEEALYPAGDPVIAIHTMETGKRLPRKAMQENGVIHLLHFWISTQGNLRRYTAGTIAHPCLLCCYSW